MYAVSAVLTGGWLWVVLQCLPHRPLWTMQQCSLYNAEHVLVQVCIVVTLLNIIVGCTKLKARIVIKQLQPLIFAVLIVQMPNRDRKLARVILQTSHTAYGRQVRQRNEDTGKLILQCAKLHTAFGMAGIPMQI